jgi:hypothetical protein
MSTLFYEIRPSLIQAHHTHFLAKHQQNMPGNSLAVISNVAGDAVLVKVNCNEQPDEVLPQGLAPTATYNIEDVRLLLQTPAWRTQPSW